ncbi:tyrosine-type recombinase/integrase [Psychrobacillus sp. FSL K6-2684]|uniref:tyrosine-type recombinase/integrase n=1 Tax=Psychrobacillus sp. FSL K6-2684 TaxID=2921547 RepID=UPI0030FAEF6D
MIEVEPIKDPDQLDNLCEHLKSKNYRNYVMFMIGMNTGLRISDILKLKVSDVRNTEFIITTEIKTGKKKKVIISLPLKKVLDPFIEGKADNEYLIKSNKKTKKGAEKPISRQAAYMIIRDAARTIGFTGNVGTHTMRKTFGYHYYKKYKNLARLQKIFNHREEHITLVYIGVDQETIDREINNLWN